MRPVRSLALAAAQPIVLLVGVPVLIGFLLALAEFLPVWFLRLPVRLSLAHSAVDCPDCPTNGVSLKPSLKLTLAGVLEVLTRLLLVPDRDLTLPQSLHPQTVEHDDH